MKRHIKEKNQKIWGLIKEEGQYSPHLFKNNPLLNRPSLNCKNIIYLLEYTSSSPMSLLKKIFSNNKKWLTLALIRIRCELCGNL